jgi:hypothetical protein
MAEDREIQVLLRYFLWADRMRIHFEDALNAAGGVPDVFEPRSEDEALAAFNVLLYISMFYGTLYVVVEGWRDLGLSDPEVDELLNSSNVGLLKRYRHGCFHFQRDYWDDRFMGLLREGEATAAWIQSLHGALDRFFEAWTKEHHGKQGLPSPEEIMRQLREAEEGTV